MAQLIAIVQCFSCAPRNFNVFSFFVVQCKRFDAEAEKHFFNSKLSII